jgi:hypothetical protein
MAAEFNPDLQHTRNPKHKRFKERDISSKGGNTKHMKQTIRAYQLLYCPEDAAPPDDDMTHTIATLVISKMKKMYGALPKPAAEIMGDYQNGILEEYKEKLRAEGCDQVRI